jgi:hypothetical protein
MEAALVQFKNQHSSSPLYQELTSFRFHQDVLQFPECGNVPLLAIGMAAGALAYNYSTSLQFNDTSSPAATCEFFKMSFPTMKILPSDSNYTAEDEGKSLLFLILPC